MKYGKISLEQIDLRDQTFSVNFMPDLQSLRSSMKEVGVIQPVILRERPDRYQIVCGFRRISILREWAEPDVEARVFAEKEKEDLELFSFSLHENLTTRGFNAVEKAIALEKLTHCFHVDRPSVIKTFLPLLSLETNEKILNTFLSLARLEDEVKEYVVKEEVSRTNIRRFSAMAPADRMAALSLFSCLRLGENSLREILTLLEEVSRRDQRGVRGIVERPEMEAILSQQELTPSQRTERIKKVLMEFRYPRMRNLEEDFEEKRRGLSLPSNVVLRHPPFFEGKGLRIECQFETIGEYRSIISSLTRLSEKAEFVEMLQDPPYRDN